MFLRRANRQRPHPPLEDLPSATPFDRPVISVVPARVLAVCVETTPRVQLLAVVYPIGVVDTSQRLAVAAIGTQHPAGADIRERISAALRCVLRGVIVRRLDPVLVLCLRSAVPGGARL
jgi:hypothetical protein